MIDIKLKYQASAFANVKHITPSSENISVLLEIFRDKELIPGVIQEIGHEVGIGPRIMLKSIKPEWGITFGSRRINIEKSLIDPKGDNLGNLKDFCADSTDFFARIFSRFKMRSNRLALVATYLFEEMASPTLNEMYKKVFNSLSFYTKFPPSEWNTRSAAKMPFSFAGLDEQINALISIDRVKMELALPDSVIPLDRIQVQFDLNTIPESTDSRFDIEHLSAFYTDILPIHNALLKEVEDKVNG